MAGNGNAVLFTINIPTAVEELRLRNAHLARQESTATEVQSSSTSCTTTTTDTQSLQTLKLSESPSLTTLSQLSAYPNKSVPAIQIQLVGETSREHLLPDQAQNNRLTLLPIDTPMEQVLREILRKFQIENAIWLANHEGNMYSISFTIEFNELYEKLCDTLHEWGIGDREGSTMSVMNCLAYKTFAAERAQCNESPDSGACSDNINAQKHSAWNRFMNSVRSRLNVAQIVRDVRQDAAITFDFVVLLVSAAILAAFGLVENSTIFLASSMLISPLMGPIIAAIFGTVIQERTLRRLGMCNELIGILLATLVGFIFGLVVCTTDQKYGIGEGLTEEMLSRCDIRSVYIGIFTAIPSGAAAAIGILGGNIGSLVGVAISASLLPPAVNSGLLWALACVYKVFENDDSRYLYVVKSRTYSENQAAELAIHGTVSMCLTLSNVLCIYVMGILVLKVKEIAPVISRSNCRFWKHDIKVAREQAQHGMMSTDAAIIDEFTNLAREDQQALGINYDFLQHFDGHTHSARQNTWSPTLNYRHSFSVQPPQDPLSNIYRLEQLYSTISNTEDQGQVANYRRRRPMTTDVVQSIHISKSRPRFSTMPSGASREQLHQTVVTVADPQKAKRFTVTPASEDVLLH